jgi:hypothetical protein
LDGPTGQVVGGRRFNGSDANSISNPTLSLLAGTYTLTVDGEGDATGNYQFCIEDFADATLITPGAAVSGTLSPANQTDLYQFTAIAGDTFAFDLLNRSGANSAIWRLIDPVGRVVFSNFLSDVATSPLLAGVHTLLVEGHFTDTGTGTYSFNVSLTGNTPPVPVSGTPLTIGSNVSGNIATAGAEDVYTFSLASASSLYFDSLTNNTFNWSLEGPLGQVIGGRSFQNSDAGEISNPVLNLVAGDYALRVRGTSGTTGAYQFALRDLTTAAPLQIGAQASGTLSPARTSAFFTFEATAGDRLFFDQISSSGFNNTPTWRLIDPFGNLAFSQSFSDFGVLSIPRTGRYTLLIEGRIFDPNANGNFSFTVHSVSDGTTPINIGQTINSAISPPGQVQRFTFSLAVPTKIYFDSLTNLPFVWSLTGPTGTLVSGRSFQNSDSGEFSSNPLIDLAAGEYTLSVDGSGDDAGAFAFRLLPLSEAIEYAPGATESGTLTPARSTRVYRFNAAAGDRFFFDAVASNAFNNTPTWRLLDPFGNTIFRQGFSDIDTLTLTRGERITS